MLQIFVESGVLRVQGLGTNPEPPKSAQVYVSPAFIGGRRIYRVPKAKRMSKNGKRIK
jgi:hypothetical protein